MAISVESLKPTAEISPSDLRQECIVKKLIQEGRTPFIVVYDGTDLLDDALCFIPNSDANMSQTLKISFSDAIEIAKLRDKLTRES